MKFTTIHESQDADKGGARFMTYAPPFILGRSSIEKTSLNLGFIIEILSDLGIV